MYKHFDKAVTLVLLTLAAIFKSPAFAYASVLSLVASLIREAVENKLLSLKDIKITVPEETVKKIQSLEGRLTKMEIERAQRGF